MNDALIARPVAGARAFASSSPEAVWSRAAQMIGIGVYLSAGGDVIAEMQSEAPELLIPGVAPLGDTRISMGQLLETDQIREISGRRRYYDEVVWDGYLEQLWSDVRQSGDPTAALTLLYAALRSNDEIVRVAAAASLAPLIEGEPDALLESVLVDGCMATNLTTYLLAAHGLAKVAPEHPVLQSLVPGDLDKGGPEPVHTSITIHGTFARFRSEWYRPGSKMHSFLKREVSNDLYAGGDYYRWTGSYHDAARRLGAEDLLQWARKHRVKALDTVYAHSHGGNVALDALEDGLKIRLLVLLSVPAIPRSEDSWNAIFGKVGRVVGLRSKMDLVIYADRSRQRFRPAVRQLIPPGLWFAHGALLEPRVWRKHRLPQEISYERGLAGHR